MTITQTITSLPTAPDPATMTRDEFNAAAAVSVLAQKAMTPEINAWAVQANALAVAMNLNSTNDTSASSVAIGIGSKSFTVSTGKSFQPGMYLVIADTAAPSTNSMFGQITSYNTGTGALVVDVTSIVGSGTKTAWTISQSSAGGASLTGAETLTNKTLAATTNTVEARSAPNGSAFTLRNKIIGGDFTLNPWQRGATFTGQPTAAFGADRWRTNFVTSAVVDVLKIADAPTATEAGIFTQHCHQLNCTTADASIAAGDNMQVTQPIEGFNAASFGFGQAGTRYVTLSFWVKSTKAGVYCVSLRNSGANRSYVAEYTINSTGTWEKKTVTLAVDTTGTWLYDSGIGVNLAFALAAGSNFQTTAGAWYAGNYLATSNQVNWLDSNSAAFKLALVQLEAGQVATPFEVRYFSIEKTLCTRYARKQVFQVPVLAAPACQIIDMRAIPTITGGGAGYSSTGTTADTLVHAQTATAVQTLSLEAEL